MVLYTAQFWIISQLETECMHLITLTITDGEWLVALTKKYNRKSKFYCKTVADSEMVLPNSTVTKG